jgi:hypothetical protein
MWTLRQFAAGQRASPGSSVMPFTIESNNFQIYDAANHLAVNIPAQSSTGVNPVFNNVTDGQGSFSFNCGLTAAQTCYYAIQSKGVEEWRITSTDSSNNLTMGVDSNNSFHARLFFASIANGALSGQMRLGNTEHVAWRDAGNANDHLLGEVQHVRGVAGCTTGAALNNTCTTTIAWPSAFADTNYTAVSIGSSRIHWNPGTARPSLSQQNRGCNRRSDNQPQRCSVQFCDD